jgi:peptide/nickel transport system ATP-binding protein
VSRSILKVRGLSVWLQTGRDWRKVVDRVGLDLRGGEVLALVGESGCGKTKTAEAIMGRLPPHRSRMEAECLSLNGWELGSLPERGWRRVRGREISSLPERGWRRVRGREISMIFQQPRAALDPVFTVGAQLGSVIRRHQGIGRRAARKSAGRMLERVGFSDAGRLLAAYPHQLSGGMAQRVMIAMAMACEPGIIIADEPTTALDVTTQAQILSQLTDPGLGAGTAILLITHDFGIVAQYADRAAVMQGGRIVEQLSVGDLFSRPGHAHTKSLLRAAGAAS